MISPTINSIQYKIHNNQDIIQATLNSGKQWDANTYELLKSIITQNKLSHFLNVGCHIGSIALPISRHVNKISAVEAFPKTYAHLQENIQLNNITNINTYNMALGNSHENVFFIDDSINRLKNNSGGMHVLTQRDIVENRWSANLSHKKITVSMNRLDNVDIDNFDIMLVDIEGSEHNFLLGAHDKLMKNKPILIIELWDAKKRAEENMRVSRENTIQLLRSYGYTLKKQIDHDNFIFIHNDNLKHTNLNIPQDNSKCSVVLYINIIIMILALICICIAMVVIVIQKRIKPNKLN